MSNPNSKPKDPDVYPTGNIIADTICRTVELGLHITGAANAGDYTLIEAEPVDPINKCPKCGTPGVFRDHTVRKLTDLPVVGYPVRLAVTLPRYRCDNTDCDAKIFQAGLTCAARGAKVTDRVTRFILQRLAIDRMSVATTAKALGIGWDLCCQLALDKCRDLVYNDPNHFEGVKVIGVDEHKWSHNRRKHGGGFVTIIVDMTDHHEQLGDNRPPARLLDIIEGRSSDVLQSWLNQRDNKFRDNVKVVSMDGFQGYATAANKALPKAIKVMDPFHVVRLAGDGLTKCRQRLQRETTGRRGTTKDPLYKDRKTLLTREGLLTEKQRDRLYRLFDFDDDYDPLFETWEYYQQIIDCYEDPNKRRAKKAMAKVIDKLLQFKGAKFAELARLGRSLNKRRKDILAFFDIGVSNGPVEAINGRLEHLRGIALGFSNITHYILRCLIHSGNLIAKINAL